MLGTLHDSNRKVCHLLHVFLLHLCTDAKKLERLLPMLVALRGRVESNDPKKCELSDRKAVIHEVRQPAAPPPSSAASKLPMHSGTSQVAHSHLCSMMGSNLLQ